MVRSFHRNATNLLKVDDGAVLLGPRMSPSTVDRPHKQTKPGPIPEDRESVERHTGGSGVQSTPQLSRDGYEYGLRLQSNLQTKAGGEGDEDGRSL